MNSDVFVTDGSHVSLRCFVTLTQNSHTDIYSTAFTFLEGVSTTFILTSQHYRRPSLFSFRVYHVHRRHYLQPRQAVPRGGLGLEARVQPETETFSFLSPRFPY